MSIAVINMCGNIAGAIGSPVVGAIKDAGWGDQAAMALVTVCFTLGAVFVALVRVPSRKKPYPRPPSLKGRGRRVSSPLAASRAVKCASAKPQAAQTEEFS